MKLFLLKQNLLLNFLKTWLFNTQCTQFRNLHIREREKERERERERETRNKFGIVFFSKGLCSKFWNDMNKFLSLNSFLIYY